MTLGSKILGIVLLVFGLTLLTLVYAFLAFRVMDILTPPPAHRLQGIPGGWGIVIDDLLAGVYAMIAV